MNSADLIRDGKLSEARESLVSKIKAAPGDTKARTLLFQVLAFCGEWDKVARHLDLLISQLPETATGTLVYLNLVSAEKSRQEVAAGRQTPDFMTEPPSFLTALLEARRLLADGDTATATSLLDKVEEQLLEVSGLSQSGPFIGFSECDATLTGILEVFVHDRYIWFPLASIRELSVQKPKTLLETLWAPGRIVTWSGLTTECFLPVMYPGSSSFESDPVRMGRITDWIDLGNGNYRGVGQHLFMVGDQEKSLLELGEITFNPPSQEEISC
ncbi:MAG: type VI secretion system accessory protein TagJ [Desulfuromonadaceae bacterium]|nr:type VI secretion system accessory protein TagJ [Desulfuromonadaceae bacterium]